MAFNPLVNFNQGLEVGQNVQEFQRNNQVRGLQDALSGQIQQGGFDPSQSLDFQQLSVLDPTGAESIRSTFENLSGERKKAYHQDLQGVLNSLKSGDIESAATLLNDRRNDVLTLNGDTSGVDLMISKLNDGAFPEMIEKLSVVEQVGIANGDLPDTRKKQAPFQKGDGGLVFNPNDGSYAINELAKKRFDELAAKKVESGGIGLKDKQSINKDVTGFIKNSVAIRGTANDLDKLSKLGTGPAAIAAVFKFMKANDPTSTVREGEFATAEQSTGVPAQVTNFYNKLITGERLTEGQIQQFVETSKVLANSAISSATTEVDKYLNTFGEDLPNSFQESVRKRTPSLFDLGDPVPEVGKPASVGRFKVEVQ
jgi:hypothetical protein